MKTRAAAAFEKARTLEIVHLDLEGPKDGEVMVESMQQVSGNALPPGFRQLKYAKHLDGAGRPYS
jgi:hypothetical protein